jgi:hypothetical protein
LWIRDWNSGFHNSCSWFS